MEIFLPNNDGHYTLGKIFKRSSVQYAACIGVGTRGARGALAPLMFLKGGLSPPNAKQLCIEAKAAFLRGDNK